MHEVMVLEQIQLKPSLSLWNRVDLWGTRAWGL